MDGKIFKFGVIGVCLAAGALLAAPITVKKSANAAEEAFTEEQSKAIGNIVREYLLSNPDVIIEAMDAYQKNRAALEQRRFKENLDKHRDRLLNDKGSPVAGNPKGDVTVVEFFDYNCGYCKKAVSDIVTIIGEDPNVKVVFKEMPILSPASQEAARWALAADKQGKYYDYHVALMSHSGAITTDVLEKVGGDLGLDVKKLRKDATQDKSIDQAIERNMELARELGIRGTPGFIIGDMLAPGYMGIDAMRNAVAEARKGQ